MRQKYSISSEMRDKIEVISLQADQAYAEVIPACGNNCFVFRVEDVPILEPVPFEVFSQTPTSYGIPILFPFPNRIRNEQFHYRGQCYPVHPGRHGFVRNKPWNVDAMGVSTSEGAWIQSSLDATHYPDEILKQFPFPFRIQVTYRLKAQTLEMDTRIQNTGSRSMPCGFGIHPYFAHPEQGTLQIPAAKRLELEDSLPTGKLLNVQHPFNLQHPTDLGELKLDDNFTDLTSENGWDWVRCTLTDREKGLQTHIEFDKNQLPHVIVFNTPQHPQPTRQAQTPRKAVAIEPYTCPIDAFNLQHRGVLRERGIESYRLLLEPEQAIHLTVRICVQFNKE
ncbi:aldose 1-epimerase [Candidatus Poribacteria bacterium]|nr:aldose 1-epimerase [Candidatus Poribacteria bacterium]